jgi:hypothetical protein
MYNCDFSSIFMFQDPWKKHYEGRISLALMKWKVQHINTLKAEHFYTEKKDFLDFKVTVLLKLNTTMSLIFTYLHTFCYAVVTVAVGIL